MPDPEHLSEGPIADAWASFRPACVPAAAGTAQVIQTQQAFYAGAVTVVGLLNEIAKKDPAMLPPLVAVFANEIAVMRANIARLALAERRAAAERS